MDRYLVRINISHHPKFSFPAPVTKEIEFPMFCLQMYILDLEAGVLWARRKAVHRWEVKSSYTGSWWRILNLASGCHQGSEGTRSCCSLALVGIRMRKRWMHFSTWTFAPDYKVGWTEADVSRQVGSRWGWARLLQLTFCSHTKPSQPLPLIARSTFLHLHFILSDSKGLSQMWTQPP